MATHTGFLMFTIESINSAYTIVSSDIEPESITRAARDYIAATEPIIAQVIADEGIDLINTFKTAVLLCGSMTLAKALRARVGHKMILRHGVWMTLIDLKPIGHIEEMLKDIITFENAALPLLDRVCFGRSEFEPLMMRAAQNDRGVNLWEAETEELLWDTRRPNMPAKWLRTQVEAFPDLYTENIASYAKCGRDRETVMMWLAGAAMPSADVYTTTSGKAFAAMTSSNHAVLEIRSKLKSLEYAISNPEVVGDFLKSLSPQAL
jgi:hypothetical protein